MATVDVSELSLETLEQAAFPISPRADFRVVVVERVHRGMIDHASVDTSVEICGVMVGRWAKDANGPYAVIEEYIRCNAAAQKFAEVTFTHESWAQINQEMDTKYQNLRIIGWYHSHPNFGIFLSDRDCFIQENFFSGPGQVAFVVDPIRKLEGMFEWRNGKPVPMHHYWVGERVQVGEAQPAPPPAATMNAVDMEGARSGDLPDSWGLLQTLLLCLCVGLLGVMWGGRTTAWERQRLEAGAVAHFGLWKIYKPGFEEKLSTVIQHQSQSFAGIQKLAQAQVDGAGDRKEEYQKEWNRIFKDLDSVIRAQLIILQDYGMTDAERAEIRELLAAKQRDVRSQALSPSTPASSAQDSEKSKGKDVSSENKSPGTGGGKGTDTGKSTPQPDTTKPPVEKPVEKPAVKPMPAEAAKPEPPSTQEATPPVTKPAPTPPASTPSASTRP
ncbi:MAG: Mov34/MPN/PAD-1 family protein [Planctomycetaceae bacterium]